MFVNDGSVFGTWPKAYRYEATYDLAAGTVDSHWVNERPGG